MSTQVPSQQATLSQSAMSALKRLLDDPPNLHGFNGRPRADDPSIEDGLESWGIQRSFLELIAETVAPNSHTLETGSGLSTVCFAIVGSHHICVSPFQEEHNRIRNYCNKQQISVDKIFFVQMYSSAGLPSLDAGRPTLDFALIDGDHTFPHPMIDYYYINERLKVGGLLAIDDMNIPTVRMLHQFLLTEPAYECLRFDDMKTGIYRKVGETARIWQEQSVNSSYPNFSYLPFETRVRNQFRPMKDKLRMTLRKTPGLRRAYRLLKGSS